MYTAIWHGFFATQRFQDQNWFGVSLIVIVVIPWDRFGTLAGKLRISAFTCYCLQISEFGAFSFHPLFFCCGFYQVKKFTTLSLASLTRSWQLKLNSMSWTILLEMETVGLHLHEEQKVSNMSIQNNLFISFLDINFCYSWYLLFIILLFSIAFRNKDLFGSFLPSVYYFVIFGEMSLPGRKSKKLFSIFIYFCSHKESLGVTWQPRFAM